MAERLLRLLAGATVLHRNLKSLAHGLDISPTYLAKPLGRLEDLGYATRRLNPDDRRTHVAEITAAGRAYLVRRDIAMGRSQQHGAEAA